MIQNHATQEETDVWVEKLPDLQYSYNIKPHSAIKLSPFEAMFRRISGTKVDDVVHYNTNLNAEKMVKAYAKKKGQNACEVFDKDDKVLVATRTDAEMKKLGDIRQATLRKRNRLTAWSKEA